MNGHEITLTIRYGGEKKSIDTDDTIVLDDLLGQLVDRGDLPQSRHWVVTKMGDETAMDPSMTLAENGIANGDVLDLALPTKAGAFAAA